MSGIFPPLPFSFLQTPYKGSYTSGWPQTYYVAEAGLEPLTQLPPLNKYQDFRCAPTHLVFVRQNYFFHIFSQQFLRYQDNSAPASQTPLFIAPLTCTPTSTCFFSLKHFENRATVQRHRMPACTGLCLPRRRHLNHSHQVTQLELVPWPGPL